MMSEPFLLPAVDGHTTEREIGYRPDATGFTRGVLVATVTRRVSVTRVLTFPPFAGLVIVQEITRFDPDLHENISSTARTYLTVQEARDLIARLGEGLDGLEASDAAPDVMTP